MESKSEDIFFHGRFSSAKLPYCETHPVHHKWIQVTLVRIKNIILSHVVLSLKGICVSLLQTVSSSLHSKLEQWDSTCILFLLELPTLFFKLPSHSHIFVYMKGHLQTFPPVTSSVLFQHWDAVSCCQKLSTVTLTPALSWIRWHIAPTLAIASHLPALLTPLELNLWNYFAK